MQNIYDNFTECYSILALQLLEVFEKNERKGLEGASPRGMETVEKLNVNFTITNPRDRLPYVKARKFSTTYLIGELLWYLSGDNKTDWISYYSKFWKNISDDNETANSAYGARIFVENDVLGIGDKTQWDYVINELTDDPDSRRAVIHIRLPHDSYNAKFDVPCTLTLHFIIRDNKLNLCVNMRSSDLIFGLAYDVPAFTLIQELLANELGVEMGVYHHTSNSLHVYERHFDMLRNIVAELCDVETNHQQGEMPKLPLVVPINEMLEFEEILRTLDNEDDIEAHLNDTHDALSCDYFGDWLNILTWHRYRKLGHSVGSDQVSRCIDRLSFKGYKV